MPSSVESGDGSSVHATTGFTFHIRLTYVLIALAIFATVAVHEISRGVP
ncbi:hypothetical protein PINS_up015022 [Pythium insidiosum]|nr:hypothetical protein PINS_up015022 [Pythium insidiosum]